jgi:hypothetical protein
LTQQSEDILQKMEQIQMAMLVSADFEPQQELRYTHIAESLEAHKQEIRNLVTAQENHLERYQQSLSASLTQQSEYVLQKMEQIQMAMVAAIEPIDHINTQYAMFSQQLEEQKRDLASLVATQVGHFDRYQNALSLNLSQQNEQLAFKVDQIQEAIPPLVKADESTDHERLEKERQDYAALTAQLEALESAVKHILEKQDSSIEHLERDHRSLHNHLQKSDEERMKRFDQLQSDQTILMQSLKTILDKLGQHDAQLKKIDQFVNNDLTGLAQDMDNIPAVISSKYVVHAIIPGRAWLRDQQQKIFSITEGQELEGYGKVLTIDPKLGTVILSSGQVLRY